MSEAAKLTQDRLACHQNRTKQHRVTQHNFCGLLGCSHEAVQSSHDAISTNVIHLQACVVQNDCAIIAKLGILQR